MLLSRLFRSKNSEDRRFVETYLGQLLLVIIGATVSIFLTLGTANFRAKRMRKESQRLMAMMVMSNIESFADILESRSKGMAAKDSLATWLLSKPIEELELLPDYELRDLVSSATESQFLSHDKSVGNVFSNNIETWTNIGNVQFIDRVGQCFSSMNTVEEYWNKWVSNMDECTKVISQHPNDYEGSTIGMKYIKDHNVRSLLHSIHARRGWLNYVAATMRYHNLKNMKDMGITKEEVEAFMNAREKDTQNENPAPRSSEYYTPSISTDSLNTFGKLDRRIDSLKGL